MLKTQLIRGFILATILIGTLLLGHPTKAVEATAVSPQTLLNSDGTLNLDGAFNGVLDLQGYSVTLDPARGPILDPASTDAATTLPGDWGSVGEGGGAVDAGVRDIVVSGTAVYVGGDFTDVANIPAADFVAKWDGANWSALGSNGADDGALGGSVYALLVDGSDLYVGGSFNNVNNNGTVLETADYLAKWDGTNWSAFGSNGAGDGALTATVYALGLSGANLYVGGSFTNVNNNGVVVPEADYIARWDGANWSALGSDGAGNGALSALVDAIAINGTDVYVGGYFINVNNNGTPLPEADYLAKWDGTDWSALGSNGAGNGALSSFVYALGVSGTDLYVSGLFTNVNNNGVPLPEADYLAKWDGTDWSALGSNGAGDGALNSYVLTLLVDGSDVYVGGAFTNVNNNGTAVNTADYLAKWDGTNWSALGNDGAGNGAIPSKSTPYIAALALNGSELFAGGGFFDLNNGGSVLPQADYIAKWDTGTSAWSSLGTVANGSLVNGYTASQVNAIAVVGTAVYVGGLFSNVSNHGINIPEADYIVKWDTLTENWSALGSNGAGNGALFNRVQALAVNGTDLYVGGNFINVNNNGVMLPTADYVAKWDTLTENWSALGSNGAGNGALPSGSFVTALAMNGSTLIVGGGFNNLNNNGSVIPEADYIAQWDGANWSALGSNGAGDGALNGSVMALTVDGTTLYVGGTFTNAATLPTADYVAKWSGGSWSALGSNGSGDGSLNNGVTAIAVAGSSVYVGGSFTNVNNGGVVLNTADLIAEWDTGTGNWSALGSNGMGDGIFCTACGSSIAAIFVDGTDVYIGGTFTNLNSNGAVLDAADYIAKWDGTSWSALGNNGAGNGAIPTNINSRVHVITSLGTDLLVGGNIANLSNNGAALPEADYLAIYGISNEGPDTTPPTVVSVTRLDANPTSATTVRFLVTFSESVSGLDASNFQLATSGITGAKVIQMGPFVNGIGPITVNTGGGVGTIRLDVIDDDTIKDAAGLPLGGVGLDNGTFTSGEVYQIQMRQLYLPLVLR
ncbi:MAG: hypothetical protein H6657_28940 [Ardenticatenaceae bacterium]|nr:hypothetical protein [Ardenticatenaceae bacterium]